ncbi:MAG: PAS domain-containing protein [Nitrospirae bacterium]|nr:PAS domain-containing protein [Nitrospirota bacterium]
MLTENAKLNVSLSDLPLSSACLDAKFRFIWVNDLFAELTGRSEKELLGKRCYEIIGEYADDPGRKGLEKVCSFCKKGDSFNSKKVCMIERPFKDGFLRVKMLPQTDKKGTPYVLGLFEPITESMRAEEGLLENVRQYPILPQEYHTLLDTIHNAILLLSPDLKIIWANKYVNDLMGFSISDSSRQYCFDLLKHAGKPCEECHALSCIRTGKPTSGKIASEDGRIWASDAFPVKDDQGRVNKIIMIYRDVTDEIKLRAETIHAAHMASLGELAAGVAHEINNPINGIINYARMLADKSQAGNCDPLIPNEIMREGRRIAKIVNTLLSFARAKSEDKTLICICLHEVLYNTLSLSKKLLETNGVQLKIDLAESPLPVNGIANQIQQVFLNVITNALYALNKKYPDMHEDKILEISGKKIRRDGQPYFRIIFRDRGTGIPDTILNKVYQPFFSTKPAGQGTGLGLSISYNIIRDHKGRMQIESKEGEYTSVIIELPVKCKKARTAPMKKAGNCLPGPRKEKGKP